MSTMSLAKPRLPGHTQEPPVKTSPRTEAEKESRRRAGPRLVKLGVLAVLVLGGALAAGTLPKLRQEEEVDATAEEVVHQTPRAMVAVARPAGATADRELPGTTMPLLEASLYARTTGYLRNRLVDIGDPVKKGQLLAEIHAPDVDDQLTQAKANVAQAKAALRLARANAGLAKTTLERDLKAGAGIATPLEQIDQERAQVSTTEAQVDSAQASIKVNEAMVQRFTDLKKFQKIKAPFDGIITARNVDPGDLVSADSPSATRELFHLMRTDVVRVMVYVPQKFATGIKVGLEAVVYQREDPLRQFHGKVTRTAHALDPNTRTLLTEVQVPNPDGALRPGMFLQVRFTFHRELEPLLVPSAALVTRTGGPKIAVLDDHQQIHYHRVRLGRDYGQTLEILSGLKAGDRVVVHPGDDLPEGTTVDPVPLKTK